MRKSTLLTVGLVTLFTMAWGLSYAADVTTIKMANIVPLSGPAAPWGIAAQRALRMGAEDVGIFIVAGKSYRWEIVDYDNKYLPNEALSALNRAIFTDNIRYGYIVGSGIHPPLLPLIRDNKFLDMAAIAAGKKFTNPENPTLFRIQASTDQLIMTFFEDIYRIYNTKRVAVIVPNDEMGKADWELLRQLHKERKVETQIVAEEFFERGMTDFYPVLRRMLAKNPDMIFTDAAPTGTVALIAKQARELGFTNIIYSPTAALEAKVLWDTAGKSSDKILVPRMWAKPPTKIYADLERRMVEKYKEPMLGVIPEVYPLVPWIAEAMKKANSVDVEKVVPALADTPYKDHPNGPAYWGGEKYFGIKRQIIYPLPLSITENGKWKEVLVKESVID